MYMYVCVCVYLQKTLQHIHNVAKELLQVLIMNNDVLAVVICKFDYYSTWKASCHSGS